jgi:hypothetical protein
MTTQEIEQERTRLQNRIDEMGIATWSGTEVRNQLWGDLMVQVKSHLQNDKGHHFDIKEIVKAQEMFDKGLTWLADVQSVQSK